MNQSEMIEVEGIAINEYPERFPPCPVPYYKCIRQKNVNTGTPETYLILSYSFAHVGKISKACKLSLSYSMQRTEKPVPFAVAEKAD